MQPTRYAPLLCFLIFLLIYGVTSRANLQVSDEIAVFGSGISLATNGSLDIESLRWLQAWENLGHEGPDGRLYTKYFPGNVLGTALIYRFAQKPDDAPYVISNYASHPEVHLLAPSNVGARLALRLNALLGALGVAALYAFLLRRFDWKTATLTVLLFGLCTDWWYQARGLFSEIGAGAFLIICLYFAEAGIPFLSGLALGLSVLFRPTNLLGIPIWLLGVWKKGWSSLWTGILIALGFCALLAYNWLRYKSLLDFGYTNEHFDAWIVEGLVGVLFSPGRSLFFYSPILILSLSGGLALYRMDRVLTGTLLIVIVGYILSAAMWHAWDGGTSWGSRLITPILPLLGIFLAPMVQKALSPEPEKTRFYIPLLAGFGFSIQLITMLVNPLQVLIYYTAFGPIPYGDAVNTFQDSWLSLQIRYLQHWNLCDLDSYSLRQLFARCR
jgi:hypothetical protein